MTQYQRIIKFLTAKKTWATYLELATRCRTNCPWKRIEELEQRGYIFHKSWSGGDRPHRLISLVAVPK